jgi:large conductance mechanosensitive channel
VLKGFRDFILRGNVIELAVAVVIGTAFNNVVTKFSEAFILPLVRLLGGGGDADAKDGIELGNSGEYLNWPLFLNALLGFAITAAVVYFIFVYPMNKLAERRKRGEEPESESPSDEVRLLTEIRDALVAQRGTPAAAGRTNAPDAPVKPGD